MIEEDDGSWRGSPHYRGRSDCSWNIIFQTCTSVHILAPLHNSMAEPQAGVFEAVVAAFAEQVAELSEATLLRVDGEIEGSTRPAELLPVLRRWRQPQAATAAAS